MVRFLKRAVLGLVVLVAALWVGNSSLLVAVPDGRIPQLVAHRGVHHIFAGSDRDAETCRAAQVEPITHALIENTLPSMRAAFAAGADVVELDVHLTRDGVFAVFHDWTLDCQTNGQGVTHKQDWAALSGLDLGFGLTADGVTFPLRGQGIGLMPTLTEVLAAGLPGPVFVNFKSRSAEEGTALADLIAARGGTAGIWGVYGGGPPTNAALRAVPGLRGFDKATLLRCLRDYALVGWSGHVPASCRDRIIAVPTNYAGFLWGWPHRFTDRMARVGTDVILVGPYGGDGFTTGIDDAAMLARVPAGFGGYVWTNRIEVIGPLVKSNASD